MNEMNNPNKKRILIIDDNTQIHQDFKKVLLISKDNENDLDILEEALLGKISNQQDETYSIDYASQGEEGYKMVENSIIEKEPYAVAFIDVRMPPGWDGIETISKIWKIYPDLQVVICTAYSDYSWDELFNKFGNTDKLLILKKPFDNIEVRQLTYTLSKKWELNRIANLKLGELEINVEKRTKELQQSEEKYRTMIENSNDLIWTLDTNGNFIYYNRKSEELSDHSIKKNSGISFVPIILEEDLEMVQNVFLDTLAGNPNHYEVRIHNNTRTKIITLSVNTAPIFKEGKVVGTVSFGRNITEQKKAEKALQESEGKYQTLANALPQFIYCLDKDLKYVSANKAYREACDKLNEDIIGKTSMDLFKEEIAKQYMESDRKVIETGKLYDYIEKSKSIGDGDKWVHIVKVPIRNKKNDIIGMTGIYWDITERKQSEEEIQLSRERLHVLTKILRHDLTNDFAVIRSALRLYRVNSETKMLDEIDKRVNKGLDTIHRQRKQESFIKTHSDLDEYKIEDVINKTVKKYSDIESKISGSGIVFADESIYSVFDNLISNAIKHGNSTKLNIEINSKEDHCEIKFMDNGTGIPDKIKKKIFDEGFSHGKMGHTGIGLFIVKQTIEEYDGTVSVEDNKPKGTVFVISLRNIIRK